MPRPVPSPATSWRQQALAFEAARDLPAALDAWQNALGEEPESLDIARHLADLAFRLNMWEMAEKLLAHLINRGVTDVTTLTAFAATLREQSLLFEDAVELLKTLIGQHPEESAFWEGLGAVMAAKGDADNALIFFGEALRLDPDNLHARFNRGCALMDKGEMRAGLTDALACVDAFRDTGNRLSAQMACAHASLALGDIKNGWRWFDARHKRGSQAEVRYDLGLPMFDSGADLAGRRLFVSLEQGLGDEVLFASLLPDIAAAIGSKGRLGIGVEPRLVSLFARSFPDAVVAGHRTRTVDGRTVRDVPGLDTAG
ncbi:MAG: tetratricopeptide repeat protein, partial [Asticcacaulis sp.]|nr:tetratricopeptide repeat protein [Asticcacaulis sp.]